MAAPILHVDETRTVGKGSSVHENVPRQPARFTNPAHIFSTKWPRHGIPALRNIQIGYAHLIWFRQTCHPGASLGTEFTRTRVFPPWTLQHSMIHGANLPTR
eukprot:2821285-Amphidinium_carterae.1